MVCADPKKGLRRPFSNSGHDKRAEELCLKKGYSRRRNYATLYMKLTAFFVDKMRGLLRPGRIGETCLAMRASTSGGDTFPRKN